MKTGKFVLYIGQLCTSMDTGGVYMLLDNNDNRIKASCFNEWYPELVFLSVVFISNFSSIFSQH